MSKFFMYGTELQDIEQMMMLVPNFIPRRSGVVVVKKLQYENEGVTCHDCDRYKRSRYHDNTILTPIFWKKYWCIDRFFRYSA